MPAHSESFFFSDLNLTRDPMTSRVDFDWQRFKRLTAASGLQPILLNSVRDLDFYVPMLITLYRYARAAGQPVDLAAEAINRDFDPSGVKEGVFRASVRRAIYFTVPTLETQRLFRIHVPQDVCFSDLALRPGSPTAPHFDGAVLHKVLMHSRITSTALGDDALDIHALASEWYQRARLAGEPADDFMESIRDTVSFTLAICGSTPARAALPSPYGQVFTAPIGCAGEAVPVRIPADVQPEDLELEGGTECAWAPLHRILSVSGLDAEVLLGSSRTRPSSRVPMNDAIAKLIDAWVAEISRPGKPIPIASGRALKH
ncbi:MAG: hypothetical protein BGP25_05285 [Lysobacterales bacterium 63-13]|nr:MAG: hypothetical protein BGP25_05285 [Xanthomonadales bacterium 63-13]